MGITSYITLKGGGGTFCRGLRRKVFRLLLLLLSISSLFCFFQRLFFALLCERRMGEMQEEKTALLGKNNKTFGEHLKQLGTPNLNLIHTVVQTG